MESAKIAAHAATNKRLKGYETGIKDVNNWRKAKAAAVGGDSLRCPRCGAPKFVSAGIAPGSVVYCSKYNTSERRSTNLRRSAGLSDASERRSAGLSDASQIRRSCNFATRAQKWRELSKAGADGDGSRGSTVLDMLRAAVRAVDLTRE